MGLLSVICVFDLETDGLSPKKIHCVSVKEVGSDEVKSTIDYNKMRKFFTTKNLTLIGHNIQRFDIPVLERILDIEIKAKLIDTLALSWYLEFDVHRHGLDEWGKILGFDKPKIEDWDNLDTKEYIHRCESDVIINSLLWDRLEKKLSKLYDGDYDKLLKYLEFKMSCAAIQERDKWRLDVTKTKKNLSMLGNLREEKTDQIFNAMPLVEKIVKKTRPKAPFKKDGSVSAVGKRWFDRLKQAGLDEDYDGVLEVVVDYIGPNPGSPTQIKDWLYSLGWVPETFKYVRNKETGDTKKIPQVNLERGGGICGSIKKLYTKEARLQLLDGLSVITHRISILKGFLSNVDSSGNITACVQGLTNTLRFKHSICVNLPGVDKLYGKEMRECLSSPKGYELCGSDMCSLEENTKKHFMWKFDKDYVRDMSKPGFDAHLDLALHAGALTEEQVQAHKDGIEDHTTIRKQYKTVNYGAIYGAGASTLSRSANITVPEAKKLLDAYWERNWAVRAIPKIIKTKKEFGSLWLFNPVSELWYSLRAEKDIFSTLNQGTATWCFDMWVGYILSKRKKLTAQFHDEIVLKIKEGSRDRCSRLLKWAIGETNKELKLNVKLDVDTQFGKTYADIH